MLKIVLTLAALACVAQAEVDASVVTVDAPMDPCGGNCPSDDCDNCLCGTTTNFQDIGSWCSQFGDWDQGCCQCIVTHESSGNANAMNENTDGSYDVGMWQINSVNWPDCNGGNPPCDPNVNLQCAIQVWKWGGNSFNLWSTCGECGCC